MTPFTVSPLVSSVAAIAVDGTVAATDVWAVVAVVVVAVPTSCVLPSAAAAAGVVIVVPT